LISMIVRVLSKQGVGYGRPDLHKQYAHCARSRHEDGSGPISWICIFASHGWPPPERTTVSAIQGRAFWRPPRHVISYKRPCTSLRFSSRLYLTLMSVFKKINRKIFPVSNRNEPQRLTYKCDPRNERHVSRDLVVLDVGSFVCEYLFESYDVNSRRSSNSNLPKENWMRG
jgi:hypothetical protein